jgi:serpin peptidase inhibitor clade H protein 1
VGTELIDTWFYFSTTAHWDEKFHHKMVDNRGFMVTRSYTVGVTMMHRTGRRLARRSRWGGSGVPRSGLPLTPQCVQHPLLFIHTGLYNYYDDEKEKLQMVEMPLAHKLSSLIILMPHHVEPLERLEKLLTKEQLKAWMGKMQKKAVAISLPKGVVEVTHDLQVRAGG